MKIFRLNVYSLALLSFLGCDFDYRSSIECANAGECFQNETCQFDEEGVGQCRLTEAMAPDASEMIDGQTTTDFAQELTDMLSTSDSVVNDASLGQVVLDGTIIVGDMDIPVNAVDAGRMSTDTSMAPGPPDLVCPSAESLAAVRLECTYPEMEERRDYCQYFVSEIGKLHTCQTFCESIGLFSCGVAADCCWNNASESNCSTRAPSPGFTCDGAYESVICRCFEAAP